MKRKYIYTVPLLAASFTACGGGRWVDTPLEAKDYEQALKGLVFDTLARALCSNAGKAYTGDSRVERDGVQVKCK